MSATDANDPIGADLKAHSARCIAEFEHKLDVFFDESRAMQERALKDAEGTAAMLAWARAAVPIPEELTGRPNGRCTVDELKRHHERDLERKRLLIEATVRAKLAEQFSEKSEAH